MLCCAEKEDKYAELLREVVQRTASLVAQWQAVGFVHGVGNTDNFSILGETIDYGCAHALIWRPATPAGLECPWHDSNIASHDRFSWHFQMCRRSTMDLYWPHIMQGSRLAQDHLVFFALTSAKRGWLSCVQAVWLPGALRPRLHTQHNRPERPAIQLPQSDHDRALE